MESIILFVFNSIFLGLGLSADAFSVSVINGINYPHIKLRKSIQMAGIFAFFQALMPMIGWFITNTSIKYCKALSNVIPWISQICLLVLGVKMILESKNNNYFDDDSVDLSGLELFLQGVITSIDALLVGFTFVTYDFFMAFFSSIIIALITFLICFLGIYGGKEIGLKLMGKASIFAGIVLIMIAIEHFICFVL